MSENKEVFLQYGRSLDRLKAVLDQPENEFIRDSAIKRFEFCFELAWKSIQVACRRLGLECNSPRKAFSLACGQNWIDEEAVWIEILEARNLTSHTYNEELAEKIYQKLSSFVVELQHLYESLESEF